MRSTIWNVGTRLHTAVYRASKGRIGGSFRDAPFVLVNHVGRRSGERRTSPLVGIEDGEDIVVVASKGGSHKHPAWWLNLRANPETTVEVRGEKRAVTAREAGPEEKPRLWSRMVEVWPDYAKYQERTERQIPVVILSPR